MKAHKVLSVLYFIFLIIACGLVVVGLYVFYGNQNGELHLFFHYAAAIVFVGNFFVIRPWKNKKKLQYLHYLAKKFSNTLATSDQRGSYENRNLLKDIMNMMLEEVNIEVQVLNTPIMSNDDIFGSEEEEQRALVFWAEIFRKPLNTDHVYQTLENQLNQEVE